MIFKFLSTELVSIYTPGINLIPEEESISLTTIENSEHCDVTTILQTK